MNRCKDVRSPTNWKTGLLKFLGKCPQDVLKCRHGYSKIDLKWQRTRTGRKKNEKKKNEVRRLSLHDITIYCRAALIKTVWYEQRKRYIYQWNRTEKPDIYTCKYVPLIFDKVAKAIQWRNDSSFHTWWWSQISLGKKRKRKKKTNKKRKKSLNLSLTSSTKINSKWIIPGDKC